MRSFVTSTRTHGFACGKKCLRQSLQKGTTPSSLTARVDNLPPHLGQNTYRIRVYRAKRAVSRLLRGEDFAQRVEELVDFVVGSDGDAQPVAHEGV